MKPIIRYPDQPIPADGREIMEITEPFAEHLNDARLLGHWRANIGMGMIAVTEGFHKDLVEPVETERGHSLAPREAFVKITPILFQGEEMREGSEISAEGFLDKAIQADLQAGRLIPADSVYLVRPISKTGSWVLLANLYREESDNSQTVGELKKQIPTSIMATDEGIFGQQARPSYLADLVPMDDKPTEVKIVVDPSNPEHLPTLLVHPEDDKGITVGHFILGPLMSNPRQEVDYTQLRLTVRGPDGNNALRAGLVLTASSSIEQLHDHAHPMRSQHKPSSIFRKGVEDAS